MRHRLDQDVDVVPEARDIFDSMQGLKATTMRLAEPHDSFTWQGVIRGQSSFALFEPEDLTWVEREERRYDVLRLINAPEGAATAPDIRGLYIARSRGSGEVVTFKIVDNPNYGQQVDRGDLVVDKNDRTLMRQVTKDMRRFVAKSLTPEESIAAADELELAARVHSQPA